MILVNKMNFDMFCLFIINATIHFKCWQNSAGSWNAAQSACYIENIRILSGKYKIDMYELWKQGGYPAFSARFRRVCKWIIYFSTIYVYCVYTVSKNPKPLPICLKRAETSIVLIVFHGVLYDVRAYIATVFTVAQHESGTR